MAKGKRPKGTQRDGVKTIPFDQWQWLQPGTAPHGYDEETGESWVLEDGWLHRNAIYEEPVTKEQALRYIMEWTEGEFDDLPADVYVWIDYSDGTHFSASEGDIDETMPRSRSRFSKSGIMGITLETGDYTVVWGKEFDRDGNKVPIMTLGNEDEGIAPRSNVFSGYKTVEEWYVRRKRYEKQGRVRYGEPELQSTHNFPDRVNR